MQITFDLNNQADIDNVRKILDTHVGEVKTIAVGKKTQAVQSVAALAAALVAAPSTTRSAAPKPADTASAPAATSLSEDSATDAKQPTLEDITKVTTSFSVELRPKLLEILKGYGVAKASLIPKDKWAEYIAACHAVLGG